MAEMRTERPRRLLFVQTQAEMAGAQEISRILGEGLSRPGPDGAPSFDVHHLFLYRKTAGCDFFPNVRFAATERPRGAADAARFVRRLFGTMRELRPDTVLTFQHYGNIVAAPVARICGVPHIIANHVSAPATISGPVRMIDKAIGLAGIYDAITVNSHATASFYADYPARYARRIVHVPHGFALRQPTLAKPDARAQFKLPPAVPLIGTVARLHPLKRIHLAIAALERLPDVHLAIAGQGPEGDRLRAVAEARGLSGRVHFAGEMEPAAVGDFLGALDAFVFPSEAESFGLAAVEAAQAGVPVIANDLPVLREVLAVNSEPAAIFVDAADVPALADAMGRVLTDAALAARLSQLGPALAQRYSIEAMVEAYRKLILDGEAAPLPSPSRADAAQVRA